MWRTHFPSTSCMATQPLLHSYSAPPAQLLSNCLATQETPQQLLINRSTNIGGGRRSRCRAASIQGVFRVNITLLRMYLVGSSGGGRSGARNSHSNIPTDGCCSRSGYSKQYEPKEILERGRGNICTKIRRESLDECTFFKVKMAIFQQLYVFLSDYLRVLGGSVRMVP